MLLDIVGDQRVATGASWVLVLVAMGPLLGAALASLLQALRGWLRGRAAERAKGGAAPRAGDTTVLVGTADRLPGDEDQRPFVFVDVHQQGWRTKHQGRSARRWTGKPGPVQARPFALRLDSGGVVRVEPAGRVELLDQLDWTESTGQSLRVRRAAVEPGERVQLFGTVEETAAPGEGYRDAGRALVVRPPHGGPMVVASEDELQKTAAKDVRTGLLGAALAGLFLAFEWWAVAGTFVRLGVGGQVVEAEARRLEVERVRRKRGNVSVYVQLVAHYDGYVGELKDYVDTEVFSRLLSAEATRGDSGPLDLPPGTRTRWVVLRGDPSVHQLGSFAGLPGEDVKVLAIFTVVGLMLYSGWRFARAPWYRKPYVQDIEPE